MPWSYANINWDSTGAMVQSIGSIVAIWASGRFIILQQRDAEVGAIEGITALIDVSLGLLNEGSVMVRDGVLSMIDGFDVYRFDDVMRPLSNLTPTDTRSWQMAELVTELLPLLRNAREFMDAAVSAQRGMPDTGLEPYLPQAELVAIEEMAVHVYSRALAVLKEARRRRARWWFV